MRVLIHEKPAIRGTWALHAVEGWYLGPALNSYRCYTVWSKDTRAQCICDTLTWLPQHITTPDATADDYIIAGLQDIATALWHPAPTSPLAPIVASQVDTLNQLMRILHGTTKKDLEPLLGTPNTKPPPLPALRVKTLGTMQPVTESPTPPALRVEALGTPGTIQPVTEPPTPPSLRVEALGNTQLAGDPPHSAITEGGTTSGAHVYSR